MLKKNYISNTNRNSSYIFGFLIFLISACSADIKNFNYHDFKKKVQDTIVLNSRDSAYVLNYYSGNFKKYYEFRKKLRKKNIENFTWERASFYLYKSVEEIRLHAEKLNIDSPYYLFSFVANNEVKHPLKEEIINHIRLSYFKISSDSSIHTLSDENLLNSFFSYRMRPRVEKQHKIIHQIKNKPNIALIEQVFLVKQDDLKPEMRQDSSQLKQIIIKPFADEKSFDDLMELSKTRYKAMYPAKKDVSDMNSYRYYLYRINDYSFNAVGGYGLSVED